MANHKSSEKRARQTLVKTIKIDFTKQELKTSLKMLLQQ